MNRLTSAQIAEIEACVAAGHSLRQMMRQLGLAKDTVLRYRRAYLARHPALRCACGGLLGHRGWCAARYAQSPRRQQVMETLHEKQRGAAAQKPTPANEASGPRADAGGNDDH